MRLPLAMCGNQALEMYSVHLRNWISSFYFILIILLHVFIQWWSGGGRGLTWELSEDNLMVSYLFPPLGSQGLELRSSRSTASVSISWAISQACFI